jgi:hypothetical protein
MSITFRNGKDDIARKINTCLLHLEVVKTTFTRKINTWQLPLELVKTNRVKVYAAGTWIA